jgi:hypothetical protein
MRSIAVAPVSTTNVPSPSRNGVVVYSHAECQCAGHQQHEADGGRNPDRSDHQAGVQPGAGSDLQGADRPVAPPRDPELFGCVDLALSAPPEFVHAGGGE